MTCHKDRFPIGRIEEAVDQGFFFIAKQIYDYTFWIYDQLGKSMSRSHVEKVHAVPRDVGGNIAEPLIIEERRPHFLGFFQWVRWEKDLGSFSNYERRVDGLFIPVPDSSVDLPPVVVPISELDLAPGFGLLRDWT